MNKAGRIGGVHIKLKMGKDEEESDTEDSGESPPKEEKTIDKEEDEEDSENQVTTPSDQKVENNEDNDEEKKDVNELRKVIKLNQNEEEPDNKQKSKKTDIEEEQLSTRDSLEQKRAILQSIKDFDFQIKKNSEEITSVNKKLDSITKDLDDLVSLYEIVSEQMNPFVGLSKVTKKRIEALENFTKEVDDLKNRMNDIEAFAENAGVNIESLKDMNIVEPKKIEKNEKPEVKKQSVDEPKNDLPVDDLDMIIENSLSDIDLFKQIDMLIDDYIENLFT